MEKMLRSKEFNLVEHLDHIKVFRRVEEEVTIEVYVLSESSAVLRAEIFGRFDDEIMRDHYTKVEDLEYYINYLLMEEDEEYDDEG